MKFDDQLQVGTVLTANNMYPSLPPKKMFTFMALAFSCLCVLLLNCKEILKIQSPVNFLNFQELTIGRQPIRRGCVNFYANDWRSVPDTAAHTVCADVDITAENIISHGFMGSPNHGISFVETGPGVVITLFSEIDLKGFSYVIHEEAAEWLEIIPFGASSLFATARRWNEAVKSMAIRKMSTKAVLYQIQGYQPVPSPYCAILWSSNPLKKPNSLGLVACTTPGEDADFTQSALMATIQVSYVMTGEDCTLTLYSGSNLDANSDTQITIQGNRDLAAASIDAKYEEDETEGEIAGSWRAQSFSLHIGHFNF